MALLTPNKTYIMNGVTVHEKIIPDGTRWKDASKAKNAGFSEGELYKCQQKLSGGSGRPKSVTIHNTDDLENVHDDGEQYTRATYNENMGSVRVHFYADDVGAWQNLKAGTGMCSNDPAGSAEVGWHSGDGSASDGGNMNSLSIEIIMNDNPSHDAKAKDNGARIAAWLLWKHGLTINELVTHTYWVNKSAGKRFADVDEQCCNLVPGAKWCPAYIFASNNKQTAMKNWKAFKQLVQGYLTALGGKPVNSKPINTPSTILNFKKRNDAPSMSDRYWIHTSKGGMNECIIINGSTGSCLPNCVGYAWGRFYEITGKRPMLSKANAENWYGYTTDGYKRSQTPVVGAVICWRKGQAGNGSDGAGHVAIVEEVKSNGDVITSNSAYGGTRFYMQTVTKSSGYSIGKAYTFQGFILPPGYSAGNSSQDGTSVPTSPIAPSGSVAAGDVVKIASNATYYTGKSIPSWVKNTIWVVDEVKGDRAVINKSTDGKHSICSPISTRYLTVVNVSSGGSSISTVKPYIVKVTANALNYRKGPGTNYPVVGTIKDRGSYTIIEEAAGAGANKWGKLKSGAGWISLDYVSRV